MCAKCILCSDRGCILYPLSVFDVVDQRNNTVHLCSRCIDRIMNTSVADTIKDKEAVE